MYAMSTRYIPPHCHYLLHYDNRDRWHPLYIMSEYLNSFKMEMYLKRMVEVIIMRYNVTRENSICESRADVPS